MNRAHILVRTLLRRLGVLSWLSPLILRFSRRGAAGREQRFEDALLRELRAGDVVWDVGANVGHYTLKFGAHVGASGKVYAFEPASDSCEALAGNIHREGLQNVKVINAALGERSGTAVLSRAHVATDRARRILDATSADGSAVAIKTGDECLADGIETPNVLKIDVEGYEFEVLRGLERVLTDERCRAVFCEIHFSVLAGKKRPFVPLQIQRHLREFGFQDQKWLDSSHLAAHHPQREPK